MINFSILAKELINSESCSLVEISHAITMSYLSTISSSKILYIYWLMLPLSKCLTDTCPSGSNAFNTISAPAPSMSSCVSSKTRSVSFIFLSFSKSSFLVFINSLNTDTRDFSRGRSAVKHSPGCPLLSFHINSIV